jgi:uncharacterized membrane-anchored protein YhcB (DUF1043 family)
VLQPQIYYLKDVLYIIIAVAGSSGGQVAGIVIGVLIGAALLALLVVGVWRYRDDVRQRLNHLRQRLDNLPRPWHSLFHRPSNTTSRSNYDEQSLGGISVTSEQQLTRQDSVRRMNAFSTDNAASSSPSYVVTGDARIKQPKPLSVNRLLEDMTIRILMTKHSRHTATENIEELPAEQTVEAAVNLLLS